MRREASPKRVINVIFGEEASGGVSNSARKAYAKQALSVEIGKKRTKEVIENDVALNFSSHDAKHVRYPHDDALVISTWVRSI